MLNILCILERLKIADPDQLKRPHRKYISTLFSDAF